ncbi:MAG: nicotinate (nicotinamide) nucleotide adenylyltransferase [Clostridia bacterium]|nr:nicotinate (nicotinamide) nucleotide adenylyltransferase [Clostridia bacterium]
MKIALFGGSFDPVHNEHIRLAQAAIEGLELDRLIVIPAATPPHKRGKEQAEDIHRLALCRLAFVGMEKVRVSDYEIAKGGTSYTYLTCRYFKEKYPQAELFWLVGTDMLRDFPTWKNPDEILSLATLAVCARNENAGWLEKEKKDFYEKFHRDFAVLEHNGKPVSSTEIRVLAGAGMEIPCVPRAVAEYIREHSLYEIENAGKALGLEKPTRRAHSLRVAYLAAKKAVEMGLSERKAIAAALFHDCAKSVPLASPLLSGFTIEEKWGDIPASVLHQFTGAYLAEREFGVTDREILEAIRYHTSGNENMSELGKLIFLADMVEEERSYEGVEILRALFREKRGAGALDECLEEALRQTIEYLKEKGAEVYPLTLKAYEYYKRK